MADLPPFRDRFRDEVKKGNDAQLMEKEEFKKFWNEEQSKGAAKGSAWLLHQCDKEKVDRLWEWSFETGKMGEEEVLPSIQWSQYEERLYKCNRLYSK